VPRIVNLHQGLIDDGDFLPMSHEAQRSWFFLRLDSRMGISGLARLAWPNLLKIFDVGPKKASALLAELSKKWVRYDPEAELLWIVDAYRHEPSKSPNVRKAVANEITRSPRSSLLHQWWNTYKGGFPAGEISYGEITRFLQGVPKPLGNPSEGVSKGSFARDSGPVPVRSGSGSGSDSEPRREPIPYSSDESTSGDRAEAAPDGSLPFADGDPDPEAVAPEHEVVRPEYAEAAAEIRRNLRSTKAPKVTA